MILYRFKICIVFILALLNMALAMDASVCRSAVPKLFMTSSSRCLTFEKYKGSNKLSVGVCDQSDINQLVYVTKISKSEAVFHNYDNNKIMCFDSCREKFVVIDREDIEKDEAKRKLRRRLNKLLMREDRLLKKARRKKNVARQKAFSKEFTRILKMRQRIETKLSPVPRTMCKEEAVEIKNLSGGHPRIRHCSSKERPQNHLFCTLHETMDDTGHSNIYASLPGDYESYVIVKKRHRVRSLTFHGTHKKIQGQFLVRSVGPR